MVISTQPMNMWIPISALTLIIYQILTLKTCITRMVWPIVKRNSLLGFQKIIDWIGSGEFLPHNTMLNYVTKIACELNHQEMNMCENILFILCGHDPYQFKMVSGKYTFCILRYLTAFCGWNTIIFALAKQQDAVPEFCTEIEGKLERWPFWKKKHRYNNKTVILKQSLSNKIVLIVVSKIYLAD